MKFEKKHLAGAVSAVLATAAIGAAGNAIAENNPFQINALPSGYMLAENAEGQPAADADVEREGSGIGCDKLGSGQCGEGQCGTDAKKDCEDDLSGSKGDNSLGEGKCGEGQCGTEADKE